MTSLTRTCRYPAVVACLLAFIVGSQSARADVTAVVTNDGKTLQVTSDQDRDVIALSGRITTELTEKIKISGTLQKEIERGNIETIFISAPGDTVTLQLDFDGDIDVDLPPAGTDFGTAGDCRLLDACISGDVSITSRNGTLARLEYESSIVGGDLSIEASHMNAFEFDFGGLTVEGDLVIAAGPSSSNIELVDVEVWGDTFIGLGPNTGGGEAENSNSNGDRDFCGITQSTFYGSLLIDGQQGDDDVWLSSSNIGGSHFLIDMGSGADQLLVSRLNVAQGTVVFFDGDSGKSDELILYELVLGIYEHAGFETVTP